MKRPAAILLAGLIVVLTGRIATVFAVDRGCCHEPECTSCTGGSCGACVPACKASWGEAKTKKPRYSLECEYACVRGRDPWHAPPPECRCRPPCGDVIVKKRLYKADGEEKVERIPKYEVRMVPAEPCGCPACRRNDAASNWNPLGWLAGMLPW